MRTPDLDRCEKVADAALAWYGQRTAHHSFLTELTTAKMWYEFLEEVHTLMRERERE